MKNAVLLVLVVILIVGVFFAYRRFTAKPSEACQAYEKFADHLARGDYVQAKALATGDAVDAVQDAANPISPIGAPVTQGQLTEQIAGEVDNVWYSIESETASDNGKKVTIVASQYVHRYRAGDRAVGGGVTNKLKQHVEMQRDASGWKVTSFKEEHIGNE